MLQRWSTNVVLCKWISNISYRENDTLSKHTIIYWKKWKRTRFLHHWMLILHHESLLLHHLLLTIFYSTKFDNVLHGGGRSTRMEVIRHSNWFVHSSHSREGSSGRERSTGRSIYWLHVWWENNLAYDDLVWCCIGDEEWMCSLYPFKMLLYDDHYRHFVIFDASFMRIISDIH